ncbi:MAG: STAS domain-containing protein [Chitinivibrionales bacterium]|nr:STAS domain-containing protein [Chitinivibrionales bacterium]
MELDITDSGAYKIVTLSGKVDWESARRFDAEVQAVIAAGNNHLVFDLDRVSFLCSGAIGALTYNLNKIKSSNGSFYIVSSNEYVNSIFETLRFDVVFSDRLLRSIDEFKKKVKNEGASDK